jgi:hypothetical protein
MRCLLDKVSARFIVQGLLKLGEGRPPTDEEELALDLFARAPTAPHDLFIAPPTLAILQQLMSYPHYAPFIRLFLDRIALAEPTRYFKRWTRRLRDYGFTQEDAAMLALATFSTNGNHSILGMHVLVTYDQPMINQWRLHQSTIVERFRQMRDDFPQPYARVALPQVLRPDQISE